jgi:membrane-bound lytic murein transglycosylase D
MASDVRSALVRVGDPMPANGPAASDAPAAAPAARAPAKPKPRTYKVQRGDTLGGIARKQQCNLADLAKANRLKKPSYAIKPGQVLKLEGCG